MQKTKRSRGHSVVKVKQIGGELKQLKKSVVIETTLEKLCSSIGQN